MLDGVTSALAFGAYPVRPPVVLAPMAGITNIAFRRLCREQSRAATGTDGGLYVCEMITTRVPNLWSIACRIWFQP